MDYAGGVCEGGQLLPSDPLATRADDVLVTPASRISDPHMLESYLKKIMDNQEEQSRKQEEQSRRQQIHIEETRAQNDAINALAIQVGSRKPVKPNGAEDKKKKDLRFKRGDLRGLIMKFQRADGTEAHLVIDAALFDLDHDTAVVDGDVVRRLPAPENEEPYEHFWERVVPGERIECQRVVRSDVLELKHCERSFVDRILPLPTPMTGHVIVTEVRAGPVSLLANGHPVLCDPAGVWRQVPKSKKTYDLAFQEMDLLPDTAKVVRTNIETSHRRVRQLVRIADTAVVHKHWPKWLVAHPRPWGYARASNAQKPTECRVEFHVRGTRIGSNELSDSSECVSLLLPYKHLDRALGAESLSDVAEPWPRPLPGTRVVFMHRLPIAAAGLEKEYFFRGIVRRYHTDPSLGECVTLALNESLREPPMVVCCRERTKEFAFSQIILHNDAIGVENDPQAVEQLLTWRSSQSEKMQAAPRLERNCFPVGKPLVLTLTIGRDKMDLVGSVLSTSNESDTLCFRFLFATGEPEEKTVQRNQIKLLREGGPNDSVRNADECRRFVRLEQFEDGQRLRLRLKSPKSLGEMGLEVVCDILSGSELPMWKLSFPGAGGVRLVLSLERNAHAYDFLDKAEPEDKNSDDTFSQLAAAFVRPKGVPRTKICAETRMFRVHEPPKRKLGQAKDDSYQRASELLELGCQFAYLAKDLESSDTDFELVFPFEENQKHLRVLPRRDLGTIIVFDDSGQTCNTKIWPKVGDMVRVVRGARAGTEGIARRVNDKTSMVSFGVDTETGDEIANCDLFLLARQPSSTSSNGSVITTGTAETTSHSSVSAGAAIPLASKKRNGVLVPLNKGEKRKKKKLSDSPVRDLTTP